MNDWLKKNLIGTLGLSAIISGAIYFADLKDLIFPDKETAVRTFDHVNNSQGEEDMYRVIKTLDTISKATLTDANENLERDRNRDSIVKLNTITIYQMKQSQIEVEKLVKKIAEQQEHLIEDVHNNQ